MDHVDQVMSFESDDYVYTRGNKATLCLLGNRMAVLEGHEVAKRQMSGFGAVISFEINGDLENTV